MSLMQRGFMFVFCGQTSELHSPDDYKLDNFVDVFVMVDRLVALLDSATVVDSGDMFQEGPARQN